MAFDRKWVSDSSLDKLWNDTIEKKVANKQRRSPDFCKEAILSATLQRISSEMLTRRLSSPMVTNSIDSDDEEESLTFLSSASSIMDCDEHKVLSDCSSRFAKDETVFAVTSSLTLKSKDNNPINLDNSNSKHSSNVVEMSEPDEVGRSPKRRWSDTDENNQSELSTVPNSVTCSPAKRPRARIKVQNKNSKSPPSSEQSKQSKSPTFNTSKNENIAKTHEQPFTLPKVKIIPAEEDTNIMQKVEVNSSLLSPVRSVVNSISELSIEVNDALPPRENDFWCLKVAPNKIHDDPLELDDFFKNLKKVTS